MTFKGYKAFQTVTKAIQSGVKRASYRSTVKARRFAEGTTSGPWKTDDLNRMDNPYAKRHGAILGSVHPFWINKQTGRLENSWRVVTVNQIVNPTPYASYLQEGTRLMFGRNYVGVIKQEWMRIREEEILREMALIGIPARRT